MFLRPSLDTCLLDYSCLPSWLQHFLPLQESLHGASLRRSANLRLATILPVAWCPNRQKCIQEPSYLIFCLPSQPFLSPLHTWYFMLFAHSTFFFIFVPLCVVFSLPGSHYSFHSSTEYFYFSPEMSVDTTSSRTLLWYSLFSSFQVRLDAGILYSQKHYQLPFVTALSYHILITCLDVCLPHQTKDLEGSSIFSWYNTKLDLG